MKHFYRVTFSWADHPENKMATNCVIRDGYSKFEDIRIMLALKRGVTLEDVFIHEIIHAYSEPAE